MAAPNIFTGVPVGSMDADRWAFTVQHLADAYGVAAPSSDVVYRDEFLSPVIGSI